MRTIDKNSEPNIFTVLLKGFRQLDVERLCSC